MRAGANTLVVIEVGDAQGAILAVVRGARVLRRLTQWAREAGRALAREVAPPVDTLAAVEAFARGVAQAGHAGIYLDVTELARVAARALTPGAAAVDHTRAAIFARAAAADVARRFAPWSHDVAWTGAAYE